MGEIEFKSQICTTREQSERLLKMGLGKATADMMYITSTVDGLGKWLPEDYRLYRLEIGEYYKPIGKGMLHIPAWSLHRLIEISLSLTDAPLAYCYTAGSKMGATYNEVIDMIEWAITKGYFNKNYLEKKL